MIIFGLVRCKFVLRLLLAASYVVAIYLNYVFYEMLYAPSYSQKY
jgi:hypothetical protein